MSLAEKDVIKIAHLARITINPADTSHYAKDLNTILQLVEQMKAVNTDHIEPMEHPLDITQDLREDVVNEDNQREAMQATAPLTDNGLYLVPLVIDNDTE